MNETLLECVKCEQKGYRKCELYWCGYGYKTKEEYYDSLPKAREKK